MENINFVFVAVSFIVIILLTRKYNILLKNYEKLHSENRKLSRELAELQFRWTRKLLENKLNK
jgi:hypothetical protein